MNMDYCVCVSEGRKSSEIIIVRDFKRTKAWSCLIAPSGLWVSPNWYGEVRSSQASPPLAWLVPDRKLQLEAANQVEALASNASAPPET